MAAGRTKNGVAYDPAELDRVERRFWREIWESVPAEAAREHGVELRRYGRVQATLAADLAPLGMMNLLLGAPEELAADGDGLLRAVAGARERGVASYVPVTPGLPGSEAAERWLREQGFAHGYTWMKFVRDAHEPRFKAPAGVEVVEVRRPDQEPFGTIAAAGFGMPSWASAFFANLPGREGWRCYVGRIDGQPQACAALMIDGDIAELGIAATLEGGRGRGAQLALLRRRIEDAAAAGCRTLLVETGAREAGRPAFSYRNILLAGFEEAYLRPNWRLPGP